MRDFLQNKRLINILSIIVVIAVATVVYMHRAQSSVKVSIENESLTAYNSVSSCSVKFSDIESMELLTEVPDFGDISQAEQDGKQVYGLCKNDIWGEYQLYANISYSNYIVVYSPGTTLVFNLESERTTESLYPSLVEYIESLK